MLLRLLTCLTLGVHCLSQVHVDEQGEPVNVQSDSTTDPESVALLQASVKFEKVATSANESGAIATNPSTLIAGSAFGVLWQRTAGYYKGEIKHAWTDVCFISAFLTDSCECKGKETPLVKAWTTKVVATVTKPWYEYMVARTHFIDTVLDRFLPKFTSAAPHPQVVNLGAGFDGRMYSLEDTLKDVTLFELDQEGTQSVKKKFVEKCDMVPVNKAKTVHHVALNLEGAGTAYSGLAKHAHFDPNKPTIFLLEDVAEYVEPKALGESLKALSTMMQNNQNVYLVVTGFKEGAKLKDMRPPSMGPLGDKMSWNVYGDVVQFLFPEPPADVKMFNDNGWVELSSVDPKLNIVREFRDDADKRGAGIDGFLGLYMNVFTIPDDAAPIQTERIPLA